MLSSQNQFEIVEGRRGTDVQIKAERQTAIQKALEEASKVLALEEKVEKIKKRGKPRN